MIPLRRWKEKTREHWKTHRPKMYADLKKSGRLEEVLQETVDAADQQWIQLVSQGQDCEQAWETVKEMLLLPSEDDVPNLGGSANEPAPIEAVISE